MPELEAVAPVEAEAEDVKEEVKEDVKDEVKEEAEVPEAVEGELVGLDQVEKTDEGEDET